MSNFDFTAFYDHQHDYEAFRNDPVKRHEYDVAVNWKVRNLSSLVPAGLKFPNILEVGCALGILLNKLADKLEIKDRLGIDISNENIKTAKQLFPGCLFIQGTADNLKEELVNIQSFNTKGLVIISDIVEHIPDDADFMRKISEVSDYVLLNLPLEKCFMTRNRKYGVDDPSGHLRKYNRSDAEKLVGGTGFETVASFCSNSHFDKDHFNIYSENRKRRLAKKQFLKRVFWTAVYFKLDILRIITPKIYIRIYGSNYFALLRSKSGNAPTKVQLRQSL